MNKNVLKEDLIRVVEDLDGTVESTDTIAKLKTKIEKETATHIGIRAEDWFRPIDLAKSAIFIFHLEADHILPGLHERKRNKYRCGQRTVRLAVVESVVESSSIQNLSTKQSTQSSRAGAADPM
ncbi:hypothetical protein TNCV_434601 [Trichonephila clavipes]|nr:hypothetical protein TNCV_434601 [Trichonephila clavipes]